MSSDDYVRQQHQHQKNLAAGTIKMEPTMGRNASSSTASTADGGGGAKPMRGKPSSLLHMEEEKYIALRKRNNIAVRKSREKQRAKQNEVIKTLSILRDENSSLQSTVAARIRELNLLNSLLKQVKHAPPKRLSKILSAYNLEHGPDLCSDNPIIQSSTSSNFSPSSSPQSIPSSSSAATRLISTTAYRQQQ
ncbi:CCAAT/enhancer-binding protein beta [Taenia crassiceps]|uniref:CCAAT/enhancer-binding protein beta n=1 Tax=Taenia crassiceps TaxID=6207 RepID=A0ABR4QB36_9CEST